MMRDAFATTSVGNRMLCNVPSRTPACSTSMAAARFKPSRPPTPSSVNPNDSWIGGNSATIRIRSEKPDVPSGILVLRMPSARTEIVPWNMSSSPPVYSPLSVSSTRKPPPAKPPPSIARPMPLGGLKPSATSNGPAFPSLERHACAQADSGDEERDRPELAGDIRAHIELHLRCPLRRDTDLHGDAVDAHRAELQMRMQAHLERSAALETDPLRLRPFEAQRHVDSGWLAADDRAQEAVAVARCDHEPQALQLRVRAQRNAAARDIGRKTGGRARELDARRLRIAEQHHRRRWRVGQADPHACGGRRRSRRERIPHAPPAQADAA